MNTLKRLTAAGWTISHMTASIRIAPGLIVHFQLSQLPTLLKYLDEHPDIDPDDTLRAMAGASVKEADLVSGGQLRDWLAGFPEHNRWAEIDVDIRNWKIEDAPSTITSYAGSGKSRLLN
jgi:hypothetical protein